MIKLVVTDLDGTVVRPDGTVSPRTRAALSAAQAAGLTLCVATGRVRPAVLDLGQNYTICHGGTLVYAGEEYLAYSALTIAEGQTLWHWAEAQRLPLVLFGERRWSTNVQDETTAGLTRFLGTPPDGLPSWEVPLARVQCDDATLAPNFPDLHLEQEGAWTYLRRTAADKGTALRLLLERLGLTPAEVICFGDERNDLPMFQVAAQAVAVANAHPELLAVATRIAPAVTEDGVACVLEELLASQNA